MRNSSKGRSSALSRRSLLTGASLLPLLTPFPAEAWPFHRGALIGSAGVTLTGISLSSNSFLGGAASGTVVGTISVQTTGGSFTGSLALSGTNAADFQIVGSNLETNGVLANGSYSINIVATQSGASGSPFTQPETITGASASQLTTLTLVNTAGSTQAANFVTPIFGHGFKQGDIPAAAATTGNLASGSASLSALASTTGIAAGQPVIMFGVPVGTTVVSISGSTVTLSANATQTVTGGAVIFSGAPSFQIGGVAQPYSWGCQSYWPDNSLKHASFMLRCGSSIAANGTLAVGVWSGGTAPLAGARTVAEVYAQDLVATVVGTGFGGFDTVAGSGVGAGISGTWSAWLNGDANQPEAFVYLDGAAGKAWRFLSHFAQTQGGAAQGLLECYHYVVSLTDNNGALGGFRYLGRIGTPWYNGSKTPEVYAFSSVKWQYGSTPTVVPLNWPYEPVNFSWSSGNTYTAATTPNWYMGQNTGGGHVCLPVTLGSTGALPTGLSASQIYWAIQTYNQGTGFTLATDSISSEPPASATAAGSGINTCTPVPAVLPFQSLWTADASAKPVFFQGAGSMTSDNTVRTQFNQAYLHAAKFVPSWDITNHQGAAFGGAIADIAFPYNWAPFTCGVMGEHYRGNGGAFDDLGPLQYTHAVAFYNQSAVDDQLVRAVAYAQEHDGNMMFRDATTRQFPNFGGTSYVGVPAPTTTQQNMEFASGDAQGFTSPLNCTSYQVGEQDNSHKPCFAYYAALVFGDPQFIDLLFESVVSAEIEVYFGFRNPASPYPTGNGLLTAATGPAGYRSEAWGDRDIQWAAFIGPEHHPDGSQEAQYVRDLADANANYPNQVLTTAFTTSYCVQYGIWQFPESGQLPPIVDPYNGFQYAYFVMHMCIAAARGNAAAQTWLQNYATFRAHVIGTFGGWIMYAEYEHLSLSSTNNNPIADDNHYGVPSVPASVSWQSTTRPYFSLSVSSAAGWTLAQGDKFLFDAYQTVPTNFTAETPYWAFNISGSSFDLSSVPPSNGSFPLLVTPSGSGSQTGGSDSQLGGASGPWFTVANPPAASTGHYFPQDSASTETYLTYGYLCAGWMMALGVSGANTFWSDVSTRIGAQNVNWNNDPRFLAQNSF